MELDLYSKELQCAVEVNGASHTNPDSFYYWKSRSPWVPEEYTFEERQADDAAKLQLCHCLAAW